MKDNNLKNYPCSIPEALSPFENSDKTAIICGNDKISYKELLADAKKVAHALIAKGVKKGDRIIIEMPRSIDYIRIYLGIIFAGGIEVTIHTGWPNQLRNHVISDCSPVLIVDDKIAQELFSYQINEENFNSPLPDINGKDAFQIVYTSGSTGIPKGAVKYHQIPVDNYLENNDFGKGDPTLLYFIKNCSCMLLDANLAFVVATVQIFFALMNEKTLLIATDEELKTPKGLADCIKKSKADAMFGVPSHYYQYMEEPEFAEALNKMKLIALTGELPISKILNAILDKSDASLHYSYGNSETCSMYSNPYQKGNDILYNPPFNGNPVYVLDEEYINEVSSDSVGEICIGGFSGQHGRYWNDPELTAKKYIDHPRFGRIFLTGDRALLKSGGQFMVLGRSDGMSKLHGQRIELGPIEKAMEDFPGIRRAAVKIQGEGSEAVLCGFYSGRVDEGSLRRSLSESLPYYMVPALLRELPELPLNINGKIDRRALPLIQFKTGQYATPKTEMEKILCEIFEKVLKVQRPIGIDDNFFELGGDSIKGMAISALLKEHGFEMKMEWLFAVPTARGLAPMLLPIKKEKDTDEPLWSLELTDDERQVIDSTFGLENVEVFYPLLPETKLSVQKGIPCWVFKLFLISGDVRVEELRSRLAASVQSHQILRTVFIGQGTEKPLQVVLKKWEIPVFYVDLSRLALSEGKDGELSDSQIRYLVNLKQLYERKPFSYTKVMFEAGLVKISKNKSILVLVDSHLLLDGIGRNRIIEEIAGMVTPVSDVLQYNRYLCHILSDSYKEESREVWGKAISDNLRLTEFLTSPETDRGSKIREFVPGKLLAEKANQFCRNTHITASALFSLALGRVIMEFCGTEKAGFISINSGRDAENAELTGMFSTGIPIYVNKGDTPSTVQEQIVRAMGLPLPDMASLGLNLDDSNSKYHVTLSMQTFQQNLQNIKEFDLNNTALYRGILPKPSPAILKKLTILVIPKYSFSTIIIYDGQYINNNFVKKLGGSLLTQLRCLVE